MKEQFRFSNRRYSILLFSVFLFGLIFIFALFWISKQQEDEKFERVFNHDASLRASLIERVLNENIMELEALHRLYLSSDEVNYFEFRKFCTPQIINKTGIVSLAWIPKARSKEILDIEKIINTENLLKTFIFEYGFKNQKVPVKKRHFYFPICYLESSINDKSLFAWDIGSDSVYGASLEKAILENKSVATYGIRIMSDSIEKKVIQIFIPVFNEDVSNMDDNRRKEVLKGFVMGTLDPDQILKNAIEPTPKLGLPTSLLFESDSKKYILLSDWKPRLQSSKNDVENSASYIYEHNYSFVGCNIKISIRPNYAYLDNHISKKYWIILPVGFIVLGFLLLLIFLLLRNASILKKSNEAIQQEIFVRKEKEIELNLKTQELDQFFNLTPNLLCIADDEGYFRRVNPEWQNILGYSINEMENHRFLDFVHPDDLKMTVETVQKQITQKELNNFINRYKCKDGSYRWIEWNSKLVGNLFYASAKDITERKGYENAILESELKFRTLVESAEDGIVLYDLNFKPLYTNPSHISNLGYSREEYLNFKPFHNIYPEDILLIKNKTPELFRNGKATIEYRYRHKNGGCLFFSVKAVLNYDMSGSPKNILAIIRDITEWKTIEKEIIESEEKFRLLYISLSEGVAIHNVIYNDEGIPINYTITDVNPSYEKILNFKKEDIINKSSNEIYGTDSPPYLVEFTSVSETGISSSFETYFPPMDKHFHISIISFKKGTFATIFFDISEQKKAELLIKKQISELEIKNEELERFTYTVSHDLKSPLITIKGFSGSIKNSLKDGRLDKIESRLARIENAANQMDDLLNGLLEFSRIGKIINPNSEFSITDISHQLKDLLQGIIAEKNASIFIQEGMPIVVGDKIRIKEAIQNLIENAIKFCSRNRNPKIEIGCKIINNKNVFYVKDNGIGIEQKYQKNIFGLFNKLHPEYPGMGLGLALVKRIIEFHNGEIWVESDIDDGATFYFTINNVN